MAELSGGGQGGLPQLPQDPARITDFIQTVVHHNTLASGKRWPPQTSTDNSSATSQMHPPTPSPGGNVQPSPKDSGVDMNSPTHREEGVHVDPEQEEGGHCGSGEHKQAHVTNRRDSALMDCGTYGLPSSVESGAMVDSESQDIDPGGESKGGGGPCTDNDHSISPEMPDLLDSGGQQEHQKQQEGTEGKTFGQLQVPSSSSSNGSNNSSSSFTGQLSLSLPSEPTTHHYHHSQNIFEKFLTNPSSNTKSLAELNSARHLVHANGHDSHNSDSKKSPRKVDSSSSSHFSLFGTSFQDLGGHTSSNAASEVFTSTASLGEHSESDADSLSLGPQTENGSTSKPFVFSPMKELSLFRSVSGTSSAFSTGLTPPSKLAVAGLPKTPSRDMLFTRNKTSESPGFGCPMGSGKTKDLFDIDLLESEEDSDEGFGCKVECAADFDSGSDSPPVLQPVEPVPTTSRPRTPASASPHRQGGAGFSPGFLSEFAKFLTKKTKSSEGASTRTRRATGPARPVMDPCGVMRRKRQSEARDELDSANDMLPVLKLRKLSAGKYAAVQSTSPVPPPTGMDTASSPKPPRLKIKYGSPEMGYKRQVVDVSLHQSSASLSHREQDSEDEYVLKDEAQFEEMDASDRLSSRTLSPPVLHRERGLTEESSSAFVLDRCARQQTKSPLQMVPTSRASSSTLHSKPGTETFNTKAFLMLQSKVVKLRRKIVRLCKLLFPALTFPQRFSREGPQVEALLDQVVTAVKEDMQGPPAPMRGLCALPIGDPCCWEVNVVMCKSPKQCLHSLRAKICNFIETLLPGLKVGQEFDRHGDSVDELLHRVFMANRQRLKGELSGNCDVT